LQATVGAGLPVIATLKHLIETGDRILKVSLPCRYAEHRSGVQQRISADIPTLSVAAHVWSLVRLPQPSPQPS